MKFNIGEHCFYLGEKRVFLNSGEIHYFRIKRELWDVHLEAACEAGLNAVSSYVPWAWHEPQENVFDLKGDSCPERDLEGWLRRCKAHGLYTILKPGPFILAETRGAGLPDWLLEKHGEAIKMRNSRGEKVQSDGVNLFHPIFMEKVERWYDHIMPYIRRHQLSEGGTVIMMQVCNEIGVFSWLAHQADYGGTVKQRFVEFLKAEFTGIGELNEQWGTAYRSFEDVSLPPDGNLPYGSREDRSRDYRWHYFWRKYYGDYLRMLTNIIRGIGIDIPLYHNLPGWIYGHGYEFPVNITMYEDLYMDRSELIFGVDHIPEFVSYRNMHDDRIINDITMAMQGSRPLFAAEFQSGSREYHVVTNPCEMELFYKASIANGLKGWNYYMFSQGRNPRHRGYSGDTFYWFTPLDAEGQRSEAFPLIRKMSSIISTCQQIILDAGRKAEVCVMFYPPYYATELERPTGPGCELLFSPAAIRRPAYFDGLLKALQVLNIDYDMVNLKALKASSIRDYKQLWLFCTDEMDATEQQTILDYVNEGGNAIIFPYLPDREMSQKPCTLIRDALGVSPSGYEIIDSPLIDLFHMKDIKCSNPVIIYEESSVKDSEVVARTIKGSVCGFRKAYGRGTVLHLGTWPGFDTEGHQQVYDHLSGLSGANLRQASATSDFVTVRERLTGEGTALLFIANYYHLEQTTGITYTHPLTGKSMSIPFSGKQLSWPGLYGLLIPVGLRISNDLILLHTTSDILGISEHDSMVEITLSGNRDLRGETFLECGHLPLVHSAEIDNNEIPVEYHEHYIILHYTHPYNKEFILRINLL